MEADLRSSGLFVHDSIATTPFPIVIAMNEGLAKETMQSKRTKGKRSKERKKKQKEQKEQKEKEKKKWKMFVPPRGGAKKSATAAEGSKEINENCLRRSVL